MERDDPYECDFCITRERVLELCRPHREALGIARATHPGQVDALRMMARGAEDHLAYHAGIEYVPGGSQDVRPPPARVRTIVRPAVEPPAAVKRRSLTFEHQGEA